MIPSQSRVVELEKAMPHFENDEQLENKNSTISGIIEEAEKHKSIRNETPALNL